MTLTNPVHATISRAVSTVTISSGYDPTMSTSDAVGTQPVTGTAKVNVLVDMGYPADQPVTAHYATNDGTAQAGRDYTATSGTVTIPAGHTTAMVPVTVKASATAHPPRSFTLTLDTPDGVVLGDATATITLTTTAALGPQGACIVPSVTWTGAAGDGLWSTPGNWSTGQVPTGTDQVCLPKTSTVSITRDATAGTLESLGSLTVSAALTLTGTDPSFLAGTTTLDGLRSAQLHTAGPLHVSGDMTWGNPASPDPGDIWDSAIDGAGSLTVDAGGTATVDAGLCNGRFDEGAQTFTGGCVSLTVPVINNGVLTVRIGNPVP